MCNTAYIGCNKCGNGSCGGGGCSYCHDDFEAFVKHESKKYKKHQFKASEIHDAEEKLLKEIFGD